MMERAIWVKCKGEVHVSACSICMPYWKEYPTCPFCERKLKKDTVVQGFCSKCKKLFDDTRDEK